MKQVPLKAVATLSAVGAANSTLVDRCNSSTFADLDVFGAKVLLVDTSPVQDYSTTVEGEEYSDLNFCNVTVTYTHPGRGDSVKVFAVLPLKDWNGRFQGRGGGGFVTGNDAEAISPVTAQGFAAASTDGGHNLYERSAENWALNSPGNVDWYLLEDFAYTALSDLTLFGQQLTEKFFDKAAESSYWVGCSTGGRQGLMLAQKYPDLYDGILAIAPAINMNRFVVAEYYTQHVMNRMGYYPFPCELEAFTKAAIDACDEMDGLKDGIISLPSLCKFDPETVVGKTFDCNGEEKTFTNEGVVVAKAFWDGPKNVADPDKWYWYGMNHGVPFSIPGDGGLGQTNCTNNDTVSSCYGVPFDVSREWITLFLEKNPDYAILNMTDQEYFGMFQKSYQEYQSMVGTSDPDLSNFKARGGKMITWHGLADELIPVNGSSSYYGEVKKMVYDVEDFYRYFEAPGVNHCGRGLGPMPGEEDTLRALMEWVENEKKPETLTARSQTGDGTVRELCLWPKTLVYRGGEPEKPESWACE